MSESTGLRRELLRKGELLEQLIREQEVKTQVNKTRMLPLVDPRPSTDLSPGRSQLQ